MNLYLRKVVLCFSVLLLFSCNPQLKQIKQPYIIVDANVSNKSLINKNNVVQSFEVGGSNYVTYDAQYWIDNAKPDKYPNSNNDPAWNAESFYLTIGELPYNRDLVISQLKNMYSNGQRKIALPIYFSAFTGVFKERLFEKHMLNINSGKLNNQQEENLIFLINQIRIIGFNEISVRFMQQWNSDPQSWINGWNENIYQTNKSFITNTINKINLCLMNSETKVSYDLGGELAGVNQGMSSEYIKRLWKDYFDLYGNINCVGFSIAYNKKRLKKYKKELKQIGIAQPYEYAIDLYSSIDRISDDIRDIESLVLDKSVIIQETYCDDKENFNEILKSAMRFNLKIRTIYQWPKIKDNPVDHFNLNYCSEYKLAPYIKSLGSTCEDSSCIWISGAFIANENTYVEIKDGKSFELLNIYLPAEIIKNTDINNELISFRFKTSKEVDLFKKDGLRVFVVNSTNGISSDYGIFKITSH